MKEVIYYTQLYDLYGDLLTAKQKRYFEDYYFSNLSFSEMAENYNISRNAIFKQIHIVIEKLKEYECILKLYEKKNKIEKIIKKIDDLDLKEELNGLF